MHNSFKLRRSGAKPESGAVAVLASLVVFVLIAVIGLAVDLGLTKNENRRIQFAVDAGALAGVAKLVPPGTISAAEAEALAVAQLNGLKNGEITAIQTGNWTGSTFVDGGSPVNSVRVTANRSVPSHFMALMGVHSMKPKVEGVALIGSATEEDCLIPVAVEAQKILDPDGNGVWDPPVIGSTFLIRRDDPGNWGVIDIDPQHPINGKPAVIDAIVNPKCPPGGVPIGAGRDPGYSAAPNFDGFCDGLKTRLANDPFVTMPIIDDMPNGNHSLNIVAFMEARILSVGRQPGYSDGRCNGNNTGAIFQVIGQPSVGGEPGGPPIPNFITSRILTR